MFKMFDFICPACDHKFDALVRDDAEISCPECHESPATKRLSGGHLFTVIKATTLTSKKYKAGYQHSHIDRPKEKISSQVPAGPKAE
jgi:putative FmdB family regulatory protein